MESAIRLLNSVCLLICLVASQSVAGRASAADDYTPGGFHTCSHAAGNVPDDVYQYSVYVPPDYDPDKAWPLVFYLHGGGRGRSHPDQGRRNMVSDTLKDNRRTTVAGYSRNHPDSPGFILVSPVKPVARWKPTIFKRLYDHVKSRVSVDGNRVYVTGFSMGGQGTWRVACGSDETYRIAAMMPLGAWGCNEVRRGTTVDTCRTLQTPVWVLHCPLDPVSKISEQFKLFNNHRSLGGYGRFTMIPGNRHVSRPPDDRQFFSQRMGWMLSQTWGTPFNYLLQVHGGTIASITAGRRPYTGDNSRYGCFEAGSVVKVHAAEMKDGKPFTRWASDKGKIADPTSFATTYTTVESDAVLSAVYGTHTSRLTVTGGTAVPEQPEPGQIVTVTADADSGRNGFTYWITSSDAVDLAVPTDRRVTFAMPSEAVTLTAQHKK